MKSGLGTSASRTFVEYIGTALYRMGVAYRRSGDTELAARHFDLAIQAMNQAVAGSPNDATMRKGRCWFKAVQNTDLNGAFADCDAALKMDPDNASIMEYRGFALYRLGRYQEELDAYSAALASRSDNPDAQFMRGIIKRKLGDIAGSNSDIATAKREDSHMDQIY